LDLSAARFGLTGAPQIGNGRDPSRFG